MTSQILKKAVELLKSGNIKKVSDTEYDVIGYQKIHRVIFDGSKVSCLDCGFFGIHGVKMTRDKEGYTKGYLCSHIIAVIIFEGVQNIFK